MREIPGFYYDEEKKKYFKITKDHIQSKRSKVKVAVKETNAATKNKKSASLNLPHEVWKRDIYGKDSALIRLSMQTIFHSLKYKPQHIIEIPLSNPLNGAEEDSSISYYIKFNSNGKNVLVARRDSHDIFTTKLSSNKRLHFELEKRQESWYNRLVTSYKNFNTFHWSPWHDSSFVYVFTTEKLLRPGFIQYKSFAKIFHHQQDEGCNAVMTCKHGVTWNCCNWSRFPFHSSRVVVGESAKKLRISCSETLTLTQSVHLTDRPKAVESFTQVPCYAVGLKSGAISIVDQRTDTCSVTCSNASDYCIDCLKIHHDENYITSSNWNGKINTLDMRMRRTVCSYAGHVNNSHDLQFHFDRREHFLYAVGSDSKLRIWDIKTQELCYNEKLKTFSSSSEEHFPPVLSFIDRWSNDESFFGMFCLNKNNGQFVPGL
eukprot:TCONS_00010425-protein